jgi:kynurenine formamidase
MSLPAVIPSFADLEARTDRPAGTSWGVFGDDDELGTMNLLTADRVRDAATLVRRGAVFSLNLDQEQPDPPLFGRGALSHTVVIEPTGTDDRFDNFYPQASSQWDALAHVQHPDGFYNGFTREQVTGHRGGRLGIEHLAERGIAARFVLVDLEGLRIAQGLTVDMTARDTFDHTDIEAALERQGVAVTPGTILLLHFGWVAWFTALPLVDRQEYASRAPSNDIAEDWDRIPPCPGLQPSRDLVAWLWDHGVAALATDNPGVEALPFSRTSVDTWLHYKLIAMLGMPLGEIWRLGPLAEDCRTTGVWEGLITAAPLNVAGAPGSTANALALK